MASETTPLTSRVDEHNVSLHTDESSEAAKTEEPKSHATAKKVARFAMYAVVVAGLAAATFFTAGAAAGITAVGVAGFAAKGALIGTAVGLGGATVAGVYNAHQNEKNKGSATDYLVTQALWTLASPFLTTYYGLAIGLEVAKWTAIDKILTD